MSQSHVKSYITIYISLLVLVVFTVAVAHIPTGPLAFPIAMGIAGLKTILIVIFFMHLKDELPMIRIFAGASLLWFGLLLAFLMGDYLTRDKMRAVPVANDLAVSALEAGHADDAGSHK